MTALRRLGLAAATAVFASSATAQTPAPKTQEEMGKVHRDTKAYIAMLEGPARDAYQKPDEVVRALGLKPGETVADIGSNSNEFWFWNSEDRPAYLYHCSYDAFNGGGVTVPFPLQPEWVLETLGMATYDPHGSYTVRPITDQKDPKGPPRAIELIQSTTGPGGRPVQKVTVFNNFNASGKTPQVVAHRVFSQNQLICEARITSVHRQQVNGQGWVEVPYEMQLIFPGQQPSQSLTMQLKLGDTRVNGAEADGGRNPRLYQRPKFQGVPDYDLAKGLPRAAMPTGIQQTGATRR